ncbi:hypothetical protein UlMin_028086 [Ulmus minor]
MKKVVTGCSLRRFHKRLLRPNRTKVSSSSIDIWLLSVCYKNMQDKSFVDSTNNHGLTAFEHDFSSRILMTYRKGMCIYFTSDVNWGCMLRSSQMLLVQPFDKEYINILVLFGDCEAFSFFIRNPLQARNTYDLTAG